MAAHTIEQILNRVEERESFRQSLPGGGVLSIDRSLPFLLVHRAPAAGDDAGTARLISGEAAWLIGRPGDEEAVRTLVPELARSGSAEHSAFLVIEVWGARDPDSRSFVVHGPKGPAPETVTKLVEALDPLRLLRPGLSVRLDEGDRRHPPDLEPLLSIDASWKTEVLVLGLELPAIYRDAATGRVYPRFLRLLRNGLSHALRRAIHEFVRVQTSARVSHHLALGTRTLPDSVWEVDRALCAIERSFDMLLLVSPVNSEEAWDEFRSADFQRNPVFHHRLLPFDPDLLKRRLFAIEMEAIDDPALAELYQDKRTELDTQLSMLGERETPRFRYGSRLLHGIVDDDLHRVACDVLAQVLPPAGTARRTVDAVAFRDLAIGELARYAADFPALDREAEIRRDVIGLMVSEGNLLIGERLALRPERVTPLLHHEVGTHVLTWVNGSVQPLEQLALGLAGYDELQEGLAVLAEYLAGGLDRRRMRLLAARVLAARTVDEGADFVETFRMLTGEHGYSERGAWHIALRVHASGGFTRDLIYLRGLVGLMRYLEGGGELAPLYIGKIALKHLPIIEELRYRDILRKPPLAPRVLDAPGARDRLDAVRRGLRLVEMICPEPG